MCSELFYKCGVLGFAIPDDLKAEIESYFNRIDDKAIREQMEASILFRLNKRRGDEVDDVRLLCLYAMFKPMGLDMKHSRSKACTKKYCEYVIDLFVGKDYKVFSIEDRRIFYRIDQINDDILGGMKNFYLSDYYNPDAFNSIFNDSSMNVLVHRVDGIAKIYPGEERSRVAQYVLYYTKSRTYLKLRDDVMTDSVHELLDFGVNFFGFTDLMLSDNNATTIKLNEYLENLRHISASGYDIHGLLRIKLFDAEEMSVIVRAIKSCVMVDYDTFFESPKATLEFLRWKVNGLRIDVYLNKGYRKISQLKAIRQSLQKDIELSECKINPSMTGAEILQAVSIKLNCLKPQHSIVF